MAGNMEGRDRSFVVNIDLGDFQLDCRAYFRDPEKIIRCMKSGCIPDVIYSTDSNHGFCKSCFFGPSAYGSSEGTIQTHQVPKFVCYNTAFLDAVIECPGCGQRCKYEGLKTHLKLSHPELLKCGRQHRPSEVQINYLSRPYNCPTIGNGLGAVVESQRQQQAVQNLKERPINNEELLKSTMQSAPPEALKTQQPFDCEMEQYKNTSPFVPKCEKWFKEQVLRYYDENIKDFFPTEVERVICSQEHLDGCPTLSSMFKEWCVTAYQKYEEHKKKCSGCLKSSVSFEQVAENCTNFLSDLEAMAGEGIFEYYQQHANGCPESNMGTKGTEATEPNAIRPPPGFRGHFSPVGREPIKTSPQYHAAEGGEKTEPTVENAECHKCSEEWSCEEIREHKKSCTTQRVRCEKCYIKVMIDDYRQHRDDCSGVTQSNNVQEADQDSEEWSRETEVAALRKRVKELEERLQKLELPIKELLQNLRH